MVIDVVTLFPGMFFGPLESGVLAQARRNDRVAVRIHDLRRWGLGRHRTVDDTPYGGGGGMILRAEPLFHAVEWIRGRYPAERERAATDFELLQVQSPQRSEFVPLASVTREIRAEWEDPIIVRWNRRRANTVQGAAQGVTFPTLRASVLEDLEGIELPPGYELIWDGEQSALASGGGQSNPDGVAELECAVDCSIGDSFILRYTAQFTQDTNFFTDDHQYGLFISGTITAVPIPAAAWLFGSGLIGLLTLVRRRTRR